MYGSTAILRHAYPSGLLPETPRIYYLTAFRINAPRPDIYAKGWAPWPDASAEKIKPGVTPFEIHHFNVLYKQIRAWTLGSRYAMSTLR